jgi:peroxiredoxin
LQAYQRVLDQIEALGASLVAVSPELPDNSLSTAEKNELRFHVLSDPGNAVARQYGLVFRLDDELVQIYLNQFRISLPARNGDDSWELPIPGTFVIGPDGLIRLAHADPDYTRRLEPRELLDALRLLASACNP